MGNMTAISRQTPEFYTDHPTQNIYGKKKPKQIYKPTKTNPVLGPIYVKFVLW
jgi:hypothetical protein